MEAVEQEEVSEREMWKALVNASFSNGRGSEIHETMLAMDFSKSQNSG
jgi:hypothetical protein